MDYSFKFTFNFNSIRLYTTKFSSFDNLIILSVGYGGMNAGSLKRKVRPKRTVKFHTHKGNQQTSEDTTGISTNGMTEIHVISQTQNLDAIDAGVLLNPTRPVEMTSVQTSITEATNPLSLQYLLTDAFNNLESGREAVLLAKKNVDAAGKDVAKVEGNVINAERNVVVAETYVDRAEKNVADEEYSVKMGKQMVASAGECVNNAKESVIKAERKFIKAYAEVQKIHNEHAVLEENLRDLQRSRAACCVVELEEETAQKANCEEKLAKAKNDAADLYQRLREERGELKDREAELARREAALAHREAALAHRRAELARREAELARRVDELAQRKAELEECKTELKACREALTKYTTELEDRQITQDRFSLEVTTQEAELDRLLKSRPSKDSFV